MSHVIYGLGGFHHVGFDCVFLVSDFTIMCWISDTLIRNTNEEDIF